MSVLEGPFYRQHSTNYRPVARSWADTRVFSRRMLSLQLAKMSLSLTGRTPPEEGSYSHMTNSELYPHKERVVGEWTDRAELLSIVMPYQ